MLRLLDLFSGIGGFSLGLERSGGFKTVAFCEIEKYPRHVLARHWPEVPCYDDIRRLTAERLAADGITVDAICGGFPCQDISTAGRGAGMAGERSGLWREYSRLIGELRPEVIFVENVAALLARGLADVLGDLAALGYDAEWHCIPASAIGAPHRRDRVWIMAYSDRKRKLQSERDEQDQRRRISNGGQDVADASSFGSQSEMEPIKSICAAPHIHRETIKFISGSCNNTWHSEPAFCRVANGIPAASHRLKALGNAVVPQIPELLGRAYVKWRNTE